MYQLLLWTDIDEARVISFLGVRTDRHDFRIVIWKHVDTQKFSFKPQDLGLAVNRYMHPRITGMHNNGK